MQIIIKLFTIILSGVYAIIKAFTSVGNKITFISRQSNVPSDDFNLLAGALKKQSSDTKTVLLCRTLNGGLGSVSYLFHMLRQLYHIASSKVLILDSYCIAASLLKHRKSLTIIQIWHSMGTMKKFGYTTLDTEEGSSSKLAHAMKMHNNYDYILASAEAYKDHLASGFNCDSSKIIVHPLPRYDLLQSEEYAKKTQEKIYNTYPELKDKENILYCPTFRKGNDESLMQNAIDELIKCVDYDRYNLIITLHPLSKIHIEQESVIIPKDYSTFDMLFVADRVISDYSCVVYEAAVRNIPLYFYCFDIQKYRDNRGLAIDYMNECPGTLSETPDKIISDIETGLYDMDELKAFTDKYVHPTKHATSDIANFVLEKMTGEKNG